MKPEVKAAKEAAERLLGRRTQAVGVAYADATLVATAFLAELAKEHIREHPEDDGEPITEDRNNRMTRLRAIIWIPAKTPMVQVYGSDGLLYWCKDWDEPDENYNPNGADMGFNLQVMFKAEYRPQLEAAMKTVEAVYVTDPTQTGEPT